MQTSSSRHGTAKQASEKEGSKAAKQDREQESERDTGSHAREKGAEAGSKNAKHQQAKPSKQTSKAGKSKQKHTKHNPHKSHTSSQPVKLECAQNKT